MKKCMSASSAFLVTAMMVTLSLGCGETGDSESGSSGLTAEQSKGNSKGTCNSIVARSLGTAQQCNKFGCEEDGLECAELSETFAEFFFSPAECGAALGMGELNGLPGNASTQPGNGPTAGGAKHIAEVICGAIEECGFCSDAQNLGGICITTEACSTVYTQDFESLDQMSPTALANDGWLIFGNVFDGDGDFKFGYGPFGAPNGVGAFCDIDIGQGGLPQGNQQMVVYSDYNCCVATNEGHFNGTDLVESSVFQEPFTVANPISASDVGKTMTFRFQAKGDTRQFGLQPPTTALAYIQTLDPSDNFNRTKFVQVDMTNIPDTWTTYSISLGPIDAGLIGQVLQFGFQSTASNFTPSAVLYDNIRAELEAP